MSSLRRRLLVVSIIILMSATAWSASNLLTQARSQHKLSSQGSSAGEADFSIVAVPPIVNARIGQFDGTRLEYAPMNGYSNPVFATVDLVESGMKCYVEPQTLNFSQGSVSILGCSSSIPGVYHPRVRAVEQCLSCTPHEHSVNVTFNVFRDYTITANPAIVNVEPGQTGNTTITLTPQDGFVMRAVFGWADYSTLGSLSCTFSLYRIQIGPESNSTVLSCTGKPGTYTVGVSVSLDCDCKAGNPYLHSTTIVFNFGTARPVFSITASPSDLTCTHYGETVTSKIDVNPTNGFTGTVKLTVSVPYWYGSGIVTSISPATILNGSGSAILKITCHGSFQRGVTVRGTSPYLATGVGILVTSTGQASVTASANHFSCSPGEVRNSTITLQTTQSPISGGLVLAVNVWPDNHGVTLSLENKTLTSIGPQTILTITCNAPGSYRVYVQPDSTSDPTSIMVDVSPKP